MASPADLTMRSQAAAWLARMRSDERTRADEAGFQVWLNEDSRHRQAFDAMTSVFEAAGAYEAAEGEHDVGARRTVLLGAAAAAGAALSGAGLWRLSQPPALKTLVGQQRRLALADGSQVLLDTNSRLSVAFTDDHRRVDLLSGRAHFDVSKDPARPFIVRAGDHEVIAIGTAFDVLREKDLTSVVLVEGQVVVQPAARDAALLRGQVTRRLMAPGDRLIFAASAPVQEDRPDLARETAWQTGKIVFENDTLQSAADQLNRYTRQPLVIADEQARAMRISGVFRTGDSESFARSVALLLPITVAPDNDKIVLKTRTPLSDG